ncbi:hypothetical protein EJO69_06860 [Flaviflexus salsibiostraticola]|uniref:HdeD family acid-resistance protein n=1 Tax=Flaviflexus salsibiostraticola TaxID=1282737 RepID=A0A3S8Z967_9ACTO|nr:DUF308 domain-containing protein [Flaviflexus salsibiostraticola]AZN30061.1 hypothetical protein EJO69_06860 [Flaviflexus salsibiostraticola]
MFSFLSHSWWLPFISGIVAVLFGILAIVMPGTTVSVLLILFAIFLIAQGLGLLWSGYRTSGPGSIALLATGVVLVVLGIWTIVATESAAELLVTLMGIWALAIGIATAFAGFGLRGRSEYWGLPLLGGVAMAIAGLLVIIKPWTGVAAIAITIGVGSILWGALLAVSGWYLRSLLPRDRER